MKTSILFAAIIASAQSAPIVSAQEKSASAKLSVDIDKQMRQMCADMKNSSAD